MEKNIKKYLKLTIAIIALIVFTYIAINVFKKEIFTWDTSIYNYLMQKRNIKLNELVILFTELGGAIVITIITILLLIFVKKEYKIMIATNVISITLLNQILKIVFMRPRPEIMRLIDENGYSFPSGHSMVSTAFYGLLIYLIYKNVKNNYLKWFGCIALSLLIIGIGLSRIYLGVHYASDVIGGFCFSIIYLIIYMQLIKKNKKTKPAG